VRPAVPPLTAHATPLDHEALSHLRALQQGSTRDIFGAVIQSYLTTAPQLVQTLQDAVTRADAAALRKAAHTLRSSSASVGALTLAALCKDLEGMGRTQRTATAAAVLAALAVEYEAVRIALTTELHGRQR
jgi:two-component system sensor histidine kinase/response regulator